MGLGNPGTHYASTRHNVGARVVEYASAGWRIPLMEGVQGLYGRGRVAAHDVIMAARLAWMNQTGPVLHELLRRLELSPAELVVIHDDLDLPLGRLRLRRRGGAGGHRGLLSILEALGTDEFGRLKVGIGRPPASEEVVEYVLAPFREEEEHALDLVFTRSVMALECVLMEGIEAAMNRFNVVSAEGA